MGSAAEKSLDASAPRYFVESLKFPYLEGLKLVLDGYKRGGWKELDRMDANPPRTTREVLHPAEYFARIARGELAAPPFDPDLSPEVLTIERLGEFHWRFLVGDRAAGWVDDRVTVKCDGTVIAETRWENAQKAASFRNAYVEFLRGRGIEPQVSTEQAMNVDYDNLERDLVSGMFRETLKEELIAGFRQIQASGERLPLASHYASQIAEIVNRGAAEPLTSEVAFELYQEILDAVEAARAAVLVE
jgi:hypothetical protein